MRDEYVRVCSDVGVDSSKERKTKSLLEMLTEGRKNREEEEEYQSSMNQYEGCNSYRYSAVPPRTRYIYRSYSMHCSLVVWLVVFSGSAAYSFSVKNTRPDLIYHIISPCVRYSAYRHTHRHIYIRIYLGAWLVQRLGDKTSGNVKLGDLDLNYPTKVGGNRDFSSGDLALEPWSLRIRSQLGVVVRGGGFTAP